MEPGVSGATWLGIPPGNENWRNSLRIPSSSRVMLGYTSVYVPSRYALATIAGPPCPGPMMYIASRSQLRITRFMCA